MSRVRIPSVTLEAGRRKFPLRRFHFSRPVPTMLETVLIALATAIVVLILAVLVTAATKPDTFRVERSATIAAPPEVIFPIVNDFHRWIEWSPWEKLDPNLKRTH